MKINELLSFRCGKILYSFHVSPNNFEEVEDMSYVARGYTPANQRLSYAKGQSRRSHKRLFVGIGVGGGLLAAGWFTAAACFSRPATVEDKSSLVRGVEDVLCNIEKNKENGPVQRVLEVNGEPVGDIHAAGNDGVYKKVKGVILSSGEIPLVTVRTTRGDPDSPFSTVSKDEICGNRPRGVVSLHSLYHSVSHQVRKFFGFGGPQMKKTGPSP